MATGDCVATTSTIHRRRVPVKREKIELSLNTWSDYLFIINALYPRLSLHSSGWIFDRLKIRGFKLHFPALNPLFVLTTWCVAVAWQGASMENKGLGVGKEYLHGYEDTQPLTQHII